MSPLSVIALFAYMTLTAYVLVWGWNSMKGFPFWTKVILLAPDVFWPIFIIFDMATGKDLEDEC